MIVTVVLVASPLQYLNALEFLYHAGVRPRDVLLVLTSLSAINLAQIEALLAADSWGQTVRPLPSALLMGLRQHRLHYHAIRILQALALKRLAKGLSDIECVVLGKYKDSTQRQFALDTAAREVVLVDDGNSALSIARDRHLPSRGGGKSLRSRDTRAELQSVVHFSVYDLRIDSRDRYLRNSYARLRNTAENWKTGTSYLFLGANLVESGVVSRDCYVDMVSRALDRIGNRSAVTYVTHRFETPQTIRAIQEATTIAVASLDMPIECWIGTDGTLPVAVGGFCSSALPNLHAMYGDKLTVEVFRIPSDAMSAGKRAYFDEIFDSYQAMESPHFHNYSLVGE